jgi:hypothetical protein
MLFLKPSPSIESWVEASHCGRGLFSISWPNITTDLTLPCFPTDQPHFYLVLLMPQRYAYVFKAMFYMDFNCRSVKKSALCTNIYSVKTRQKSERFRARVNWFQKYMEHFWHLKTGIFLLIHVRDWIFYSTVINIIKNELNLCKMLHASFLKASLYLTISKFDIFLLSSLFKYN